MMAPVMVWGVDTGTPSAVARNRVIAPPVSAQNPRVGVRRVIFEPIVGSIRQPPHSTPSANVAWQVSNAYSGGWDDDLLERFSIPRQLLAGVKDRMSVSGQFLSVNYAANLRLTRQRISSLTATPLPNGRTLMLKYSATDCVWSRKSALRATLRLVW